MKTYIVRLKFPRKDSKIISYYAVAANGKKDALGILQSYEKDYINNLKSIDSIQLTAMDIRDFIPHWRNLTSESCSPKNQFHRSICRLFYKETS